jgi:hypothetical protein
MPSLRGSLTAAVVLVLAVISGVETVLAQTANPIKIGFSIPLTGGLASNGKAILATYQMWQDDINAKGGLLGRKVELVYYDDQSNPTLVPGIYSKLLDIDKIDLVVASYGTNNDAACDANCGCQRHGGDEPVLASHQRRIQISKLLFDVSGRTRWNSRNFARIFCDRERSKSADRGDRWR